MGASPALGPRWTCSLAGLPTVQPADPVRSQFAVPEDEAACLPESGRTYYVVSSATVFGHGVDSQPRPGGARLPPVVEIITGRRRAKSICPESSKTAGSGTWRGRESRMKGPSPRMRLRGPQRPRDNVSPPRRQPPKRALFSRGQAPFADAGMAQTLASPHQRTEDAPTRARGPDDADSRARRRVLPRHAVRRTPSPGNEAAGGVWL